MKSMNQFGKWSEVEEGTKELELIMGLTFFRPINTGTGQVAVEVITNLFFCQRIPGLKKDSVTNHDLGTTINIISLQVLYVRIMLNFRGRNGDLLHAMHLWIAPAENLKLATLFWAAPNLALHQPCTGRDDNTSK